MNKIFNLEEHRSDNVSIETIARVIDRLLYVVVDFTRVLFKWVGEDVGDVLEELERVCVEDVDWSVEWTVEDG